MGTPYANVLGLFATHATAATVAAFDSSSKQYEFLSESVRMVQSHVDSIGVRGTRSRVKDRVRIGQEMVGGSVSMMLTPIELDWWLPRILGGTESTNSFPLAEALPEFGMLFERGAARIVYTACQVARATFTGGPGQLIGCTIDILGKTEVLDTSTAWPGTIPAIDTGQPYVFSDMNSFVLSADTSATDCLGFTLTIDNALERRFPNSVTATKIFATDRIITLDMVLPYTADEIDLVDQPVAGAGATMTWTNGSLSTLFTFANVKAPSETPITPGRAGERTCSVRMMAYMSGATRELVVTHAST